MEAMDLAWVDIVDILGMVLTYHNTHHNTHHNLTHHNGEATDMADPVNLKLEKFHNIMTFLLNQKGLLNVEKSPNHTMFNLNQKCKFSTEKSQSMLNILCICHHPHHLHQK